MAEQQNITPNVEMKYIAEALEIIGFEERESFQGMFTKPLNGFLIVVDLSEGKKAIYFQDGKTKIIEDDDNGTLAKIGKVIINAENGKMPVLPDEGNVKPQSDTPKPVASLGLGKKTPTPKAEPELTPIPAGPADHEPAELVRSTAPPPPAQYQPKGSMIKDISPTLAEKGAIKIGGKGEERIGKNEKPYRLPVKYDHFKVLTKIRDEHGDFIVDPVMEKWGFKDGKKEVDGEMVEAGPKELHISLLYDDPTLNFFTSYRQYKGGKCLCSGDGEVATNAKGEQIECHPNACPIFKSKKCKPNGILSVVLRDAPGLGGVYKFRTTSFNSIRSILSSLFFLKTLTFGTLANIPLKMTLTPKTVNPIDSPTAQTIYVVNIEFEGTTEDLNRHTVRLIAEKATMHKQIAELERQASLAICAPESKEEIEDVEVEYYPDNQE